MSSSSGDAAAQSGQSTLGENLQQGGFSVVIPFAVVADRFRRASRLLMLLVAFFTIIILTVSVSNPSKNINWSVTSGQQQRLQAARDRARRVHCCCCLTVVMLLVCTVWYRVRAWASFDQVIEIPSDGVWIGLLVATFCYNDNNLNVCLTASIESAAAAAQHRYSGLTTELTRPCLRLHSAGQHHHGLAE